jgi:4-hydroxythreonine-4-phosphate dehydrogenase
VTRVAITMGDPAGIGPELVLRALADPAIRDLLAPIVYGDRQLLEALAKRFGLPLDFTIVPGVPLPPDLPCGLFSEPAARAAVSYLEAAVRAIRARAADALVTGPIHKGALRCCALPGPGQTEFLADRFGVGRAVMMRMGARLKVLLATTHLPLREVPRALTTASIVETVRRAEPDLRRYFFPRGFRLGVCALNPHGEEGGAEGREEREVIAPAIAALRDLGLAVSGPIPGDVAFAQALAGRHDVVLALYHDQGLAPLKALHFQDGVNVTLGLTAIRTSPDHGVAYDIAHQGTADPTSLKAALRTAVAMARTRGGAGG